MRLIVMLVERPPIDADAYRSVLFIRGFGFLLALILLLGYVGTLFAAIKRNRGARRITFNILSILILFVINALANESIYTYVYGGNSFLDRYPRSTWFPVAVGVIAVILILLAVLLVLQIVNSIRERRKQIQSSSVKESVDKLVSGVCYYHTNGRIRLHNESMEKIWESLSKKNLIDGRFLWETVSEGKAPYGTCISKGASPIYLLPDGSTRSFRRNKVETDGMKLFEILAADVTEEYALVNELEEKKERLKHKNNRLKVLGDRIDALNIEKEILDSKIRLHDDWGHALITAKAYIDEPDEEKKKDFLNLWERTISYVEENEISSAKDAYDDIFRSSRALGLSIDIDEELPSDYESRNILIHAIAVCVGNMVKHAGGKNLRIDTERKDGKCIYIFTNDGQAPAAPVLEKGGLKNLRKRVESSGGQMRIDSTPRFALHIELGEKKNAT
ncbi:MAG: hypothetical protein J6T40_06730 [Clostridiales bacterium]|nr:hypothetical protein [Clostridiales bacterium]